MNGSIEEKGSIDFVIRENFEIENPKIVTRLPDGVIRVLMFSLYKVLD